MTNLVRLFFSTNHKYIRIYFIFGVIVGMMGTCFSVLICIELARPDGQIHDGNRQLYNVLITTLFLIIFFMVMPAMIDRFGNWSI